MNVLRRYIFIKIMALLLASAAFGQGMGSGLITHSEGGDFIIGSDAYVEGKSKGTATDRSGFYPIINIPARAYV
jgi:hypothetical protein